MNKLNNKTIGKPIGSKIFKEDYMKKQFIKKFLPVLLSATMLATLVPATDAFAAAKPNKIKVITTTGRKKSRHTLALGEIKSIKSVGRATANVRFSPKNSSKGIRLSSDDSSVVKVTKKNSAGTSWTFEGMGAGQANISIRSAVKSTLKSNFRVTVTSRSPEEIELSRSSLSLDQNQEATIGAMNKRATVNVEFDSTSVDRFLDVSSSDGSIVSVTKKNSKNFTIKALKAGTATITVASATDKDVSESLTVTVKSKETPMNFTAKQVKKNQIYVTFATPMTTTPALSSFKLRQTGAIWDVALSGITLASDGKGAYITSVIDLMKDTKYDLVYTATNAQPMTAQFTTSANKPVRIQLKTTSVVANVAKKLSYSLIDNNGIELIDVDAGRVDISVETRSGYFDNYNKTLTMFTPGETAKVKLIYHTYEYANGVEQVIATEGVVTTLATSNTVMNLENAMVKRGASQVTDSQWASARNNTVIPARASGYYLVAKFRSSENESFFTDRSYTGVSFTFESKNTDVVTVGNDGLISPGPNAVAGKQAIVVITANYEGKQSAYTISINIASESIPQRIEATPSTLVLKAGTSGKLQFKVYDQYGIDVSSAAATSLVVQPTPRGYNAGTQPNVTVSALTYSSDKLTVDASAIAGSVSGTVSYQIINPAQNNRVLGSFGVFVQP